jgi:Tfp pilus assembly protein PilO
MTGHSNWRSLAGRLLRERRRTVIVLAAILLLNVLAYAFFVYPLSQRVANVAQTTQAAETELAAARTLHTRASGTLTGKARAADDLEAFYGKVLPPNFASARRLVSPRLDQLARQSNVRASRTTMKDPEQSDMLSRLQVDMDVTGSYHSVRQFIDRLERVPEFVVVDHIALSESANVDDQLNVKIELSTYYRGESQ